MHDVTSGAPCPLTVETRNEKETRRLGARLGVAAQAGDTILLSGAFGAGKTTLVQGIASGLGVQDVVTSPSFVIASEYAGRIPLYHVDLYRIAQMDRATLEALAEYFGGDGLCVVEWPASLPVELVEQASRIEIAVTGDQGRAFSLVEGREAFRRVFEDWRASPGEP